MHSNRVCAVKFDRANTLTGRLVSRHHDHPRTPLLPVAHNSYHEHKQSSSRTIPLATSAPSSRSGVSVAMSLWGKKSPTVAGGMQRWLSTIVMSVLALLLTLGPTHVQGSCDLSRGRWVPDSSGPLYTSNSCPIIIRAENCQANGRPDKGYENWRWKPERCALPRFDARKFLRLMRGKTLAFVGDSIAQNQMESLLCILWQVDTPINLRDRRMTRWIFNSTSTTIIRIWSPWLLHNSKEAVGIAPEGLSKVFLDVPDKTLMEFLPGFDVLVLSFGHWFVTPSAYILNGKVVGGQSWWPLQAGKMQMNNIDAFGASTETSLTAVVTNPNFKGIAILSTYSPDHYERATWNVGGSCTGKVKPLDKAVRDAFIDAMYEKQVTGFRKVVKNSGKQGYKLKLMSITEPFALRVDGHPGPYTNLDPNKTTQRGPDGRPPPQDCLHWCMPGPIDTRNEMLFETIRR